MPSNAIHKSNISEQFVTFVANMKSLHCPVQTWNKTQNVCMIAAITVKVSSLVHILNRLYPYSMGKVKHHWAIFNTLYVMTPNCNS